MANAPQMPQKLKSAHLETAAAAIVLAGLVALFLWLQRAEPVTPVASPTQAPAAAEAGQSVPSQ
ncbi:MAG: hypothetical protein AB7N76_28235 [Planctomycetota bacterium]